MGEAEDTNETKFSIVVSGQIDPRQHHPAWYQLIGAISELEVKSSIIRGVAVSRSMAFFATPEFRITCDPTAWEISTTQPQNRGRILEITKLVFKKLYETPAWYFGLNNNLERQTECPNLNHTLADRLLAAQLGFVSTPDRSCSIIFTNHELGAIDANIEIRASKHAPSVAYLGFNTQYLIKSKEHFDIGDLIEERYETDYQNALKSAERIVGELNRPWVGAGK